MTVFAFSQVFFASTFEKSHPTYYFAFFISKFKSFIIFPYCINYVCGHIFSMLASAPIHTSLPLSSSFFFFIFLFIIYNKDPISWPIIVLLKMFPMHLLLPYYKNILILNSSKFYLVICVYIHILYIHTILLFPIFKSSLVSFWLCGLCTWDESI